MKSSRKEQGHIIVITNVKKTKGRTRVWRVTLDNGDSFDLDKEILQFYMLKEGTELSEIDFKKINEQSQAKLAKDFALDYLGNKARSEKEVHDQLRRKKIPARYAEQAVLDLKRIGLLDDKSYAVRFSKDLLTRKPMGPFLLRQELKKRSIPGQIIEDVVDKIYQEVRLPELALRAVRRKPQLMRVSGELERKKKIHDFLLRRGFSWEEIGEVITEIEEEVKK